MTVCKILVTSMQFSGAWSTSKVQLRTLFVTMGNLNKIRSSLTDRWSALLYVESFFSLTFAMVFSRDLCDITKQGQLNSEQFVLAMYLIHQKVMGVDPPQTLSPEMVPPSMRTSSAGTPVAAGEATVRN